MSQQLQISSSETVFQLLEYQYHKGEFVRKRVVDVTFLFADVWKHINKITQFKDGYKTYYLYNQIDPIEGN